MRIRGFSTLEAARLAAYQTAADTGARALPVVGTRTARGHLSCFVEVPFGAAMTGTGAVRTTVLRVGSFAELLLSLPEILQGADTLGYLIAVPPLVLFGADLQCPDADHAIALVKDVMPAIGVGVVGPYRCTQCNGPVPRERTRLVGPDAQCVRCQTLHDKETVNGRHG